MFDKVQLSDSKKNPPSLRSMTFKDKIKIKRRVYKAILSAKRQKPTLSSIKLKQIQVGQTVKPTPKTKRKTILPIEVEDPELLITQLT